MQSNHVICPMCRAEVEVADDWGYRPIIGHMVGKRRCCEASGLSYADALGIKKIRTEGGERLRLAAHP